MSTAFEALGAFIGNGIIRGCATAVHPPYPIGRTHPFRRWANFKHLRRQRKQRTGRFTISASNVWVWRCKIKVDVTEVEPWKSSSPSIRSSSRLRDAIRGESPIPRRFDPSSVPPRLRGDPFQPTFCAECADCAEAALRVRPNRAQVPAMQNQNFILRLKFRNARPRADKGPRPRWRSAPVSGAATLKSLRTPKPCDPIKPIGTSWDLYSALFTLQSALPPVRPNKGKSECI